MPHCCLLESLIAETSQLPSFSTIFSSVPARISGEPCENDPISMPWSARSARRLARLSSWLSCYKQKREKIRTTCSGSKVFSLITFVWTLIPGKADPTAFDSSCARRSLIFGENSKGKNQTKEKQIMMLIKKVWETRVLRWYIPLWGRLFAIEIDCEVKLNSNVS